MPNDNLPDGVTVRRATNFFNIPSAELKALYKEATDFINLADARNYKPGYRSRQFKGMVGEYKALRYALKTMPKGTVSVWVPRRSANVGILDVLVQKPNGNFVVIEAKFQADGGRPKLGKTNAVIFGADEAGNIRPIKIRGGDEQLSRGWLQNRIREIQRKARQLSGAERTAARQLAGRLRQALAAGKIEAIGITVSENGRVVFHDDRSRQLKNEIVSNADKGAPASARAKGTTPGDRGTTGRGLTNDVDSPNGKPAPKSALKAADPPTRTHKIGGRGSKLAVKFEKITKFKPKFTGNIIIEAAKIVLFSVLQGMLDKVNAEMLNFHYNDKILRPFIQPLIEDAVRVTLNGELYQAYPKTRRQWVYFHHEYDVEMHQEADTLSDAIVIVASGFEVPETMMGVRPDPDDFGVWALVRDAPLARTHTIGKKQKTGRKNVVRYRHHRYQLVHSPRAVMMHATLNAIRNRSIDRLNVLAGKLAVGGAAPWVAKSGAALANLINEFAFLQAKTLLDGASATILSNHKHELDVISHDLAYGDVLLTLTELQGVEEQAMLALLLGADPFTSKKEAEKVLSDLEEKERKRKVRALLNKHSFFKF